MDNDTQVKEKETELAIKKMDIKEFREMGGLQEINRLFLHPLGLALEVVVDDDDNERLGEIWDCRNDKEGILFAHVDEEKVKKFKEFQDAQHKKRQNMLGFIVQE